MKKKLLLLPLLLLVVACSSTSNETTNTETFGYETLENKNHIIKELSIDDIKEKEKNNDTYYLMIGRPSCSYCVDNILNFSDKAIENKIDTVYYYNFEDIYLEFEEQGKLSKKSDEEFKYLEKYLKFDGSTPVFFFIESGQLIFSTNNLMNDTSLKSWDDILTKFFSMTYK
ncbi:thioredoxin-related protein [Bacilli bacterium PM5-9]|nr:thioredoxin-related protein [Bacilli bacterium PM5-9]